MSRLLAALAVAMLLVPALPAQARSSWDHVERVVVFGDLHGDYDKFHDMLLQAGLIDAHDHWSGGKTHLVQVGDVPDRAPDTRKIMDLLMRLEHEAPGAGGYVHALIGNHEAMNMEGDLRYTTPGEFAAFADQNSPRRRDLYYDAVVRALKAKPPPKEAGGLPKFDADYRAKFDADHPLGWVEHQIAWSPTGTYGRWVLSHDTVIRIDDAIFLHAGVAPAFTQFDLEALNKAMIASLEHKPQAAEGPQNVLFDALGEQWSDQSPVWYRGDALNDETAEAPQTAAVLKSFAVAHEIVGHTKRYSMVNSRFDGGVILTDIAVKQGCPDPHAFLIKEGDKFSTIYRGHRLDLGLTADAKAAYLAAIAAIDKAANIDPTCTLTDATLAPTQDKPAG
jgi:hypothetical protein